MLDSLKGTLTSLVSSRNQLIEKSKKLKERENSLFTEAYNRIVTVSSLLPIDASGITSGKTINGVFISSYNLSLIEKDDTFVNSVSSIRKDIKRTEDSINKLTSLKGCPKYVGRLFSCTDNDLTSLEFGPIEIGGDFAFSRNEVRDLYGISDNIGGSITFQGKNPISSIINQEVNIDFIRAFNIYKVIKDGKVVLKRLKYVMETFDMKYYLEKIEKEYEII
jgi:hypothetical protein